MLKSTLDATNLENLETEFSEAVEAYEERNSQHEKISDKEHHTLIRDITACGELFPSIAKTCLNLIGRAERAFCENQEYLAEYEAQLEREAEAEAEMIANQQYAYDVLLEDELHHHF